MRRWAAGLRVLLAAFFVWAVCFVWHQPAALAKGSGPEVPIVEAPHVEEWQVRGVMAALDDRDEEVVALALEQIVEWEIAKKIPPEKVPWLVERLGSTNQKLRVATVSALGSMGGAAKAAIPNLIKLLNDLDGRVRIAAAQALGQMGDAAKEAIPELIKRLNDSDLLVRAAAAAALGGMGDAAKEAIPGLIKQLNDKQLNDSNVWYGRVRASAADALGRMGKAAKEAIPDLIKRLNDSDGLVRIAAAKALGQMGDAAKEAIPELIKRLNNSNEHVRASAADALGRMGKAAKEAIPDLIERFNDSDEKVRASAADALGRMGDAVKEAIPKLIERLNDSDGLVRIAAAVALGGMGDAAKEAIPKLIERFNDSDERVRASAADALGRMGEAAKEAIPKLIERFNDSDEKVRIAAAKALGQMGDAAKEAIPDLIKQLNDSDMWIRIAAAQALGHMRAKEAVPMLMALWLSSNQLGHIYVRGVLLSIGPLGAKHVLPVLTPIYDRLDHKARLLVLAHIVGGGDQDSETMIQWLGRPKDPRPMFPATHDDSLHALAAFEKAWPASAAYPRLREDLANAISDTIQHAHKEHQFSEQDLPVLRRHLTNLRDAQIHSSGTIQTVVDDLTPKYWPYVRSALGSWGGHLAFWLVLIVIYPRSRMVQAIFFWNPWVRRFTGLGYVGFLLTWVPFLRRRLLSPFRDTLLADAALETFDPASFFPELEAIDRSSPRHPTCRVRKSLETNRGQVVLIGETGLGKTMAIRDRLRRTERTSVYLPAERCEGGVAEAILAKLKGFAQDPAFLRNLIYSGAIDIYIDGLNEVSPDTRATITNFARDYTHGNIVMATQPLPDWEPPKVARVLELMPLDSDQAGEFLLERERPYDDAPVTGFAYEKKCNAFLKQALVKDQPEEMRKANAQVLSNPMDLSLVAQLLAGGQEPDLSRLQQQAYEFMAQDYQAKNNSPFPLERFAAHVYEMRQKDQTSIPEDAFGLELMAMEPQRMVIKRQWKDPSGKVQQAYRFRHDKIVDFFIAQTFLGKDESRRMDREHMSDPRFRGVYFLLALSLALPDAEKLKEELVEYAADEGDHTTSDGFVKLLRVRRAQERQREASVRAVG